MTPAPTSLYELTQFAARHDATVCITRRGGEPGSVCWTVILTWTVGKAGSGSEGSRKRAHVGRGKTLLEAVADWHLNVPRQAEPVGVPLDQVVTESKIAADAVKETKRPITSLHDEGRYSPWGTPLPEGWRWSEKLGRPSRRQEDFDIKPGAVRHPHRRAGERFAGADDVTLPLSNAGDSITVDLNLPDDAPMDDGEFLAARQALAAKAAKETIVRQVLSNDTSTRALLPPNMQGYSELFLLIRNGRRVGVTDEYGSCIKAFDNLDPKWIEAIAAAHEDECIAEGRDACPKCGGPIEEIKGEVTSRSPGPSQATLEQTQVFIDTSGLKFGGAVFDKPAHGDYPGEIDTSCPAFPREEFGDPFPLGIGRAGVQLPYVTMSASPFITEYKVENGDWTMNFPNLPAAQQYQREEGGRIERRMVSEWAEVTEDE